MDTCSALSRPISGRSCGGCGRPTAVIWQPSFKVCRTPTGVTKHGASTTSRTQTSPAILRGVRTRTPVSRRRSRSRWLMAYRANPGPSPRFGLRRQHDADTLAASLRSRSSSATRDRGRLPFNMRTVRQLPFGAKSPTALRDGRLDGRAVASAGATISATGSLDPQQTHAALNYGRLDERWLCRSTRRDEPCPTDLRSCASAVLPVSWKKCSRRIAI